MMGLDMYIDRVDGQQLAEGLLEGDREMMEGLRDEVVEVAYWRKANAIHGWFMHHVAEMDNCDAYVVGIDTLKALSDDVQTVLSKRGGKDFKRVAEDLLPVTYGCFFGSYDYDRLYVEILEDTFRKLMHIVNTHKDGRQYIYCASY